MKKAIVMMMMLVGTQAIAQNEDSLIVAELTPVCSNLDTLSKMEQWKLVSSKIDKVKAKYPNNWIPAYYSVYCAVQMTYFDQTSTAKLKDLYLDAADRSLEVVKASCPLKDEVHVLTALIANARLVIDGEHRWKVYGKIFDENLEAAKKINPDNPHIYLSKGFSVYYTPVMFGGGAKNALEYFNKADTKFKMLKETKLDKPYWGAMSCAYMIGECNKELKK